ncbi:MAG: cytochrome c peroxidase [Planctomycetota bacterium]|nr:cytochrome c peroxidase [Planctomycetota bacterium]
MRILPALLAVLLLAFAALAGEAASSDGTARALALRLQLPKTAYDYVGSALPEHASAIVRRRFDNTPRSNRLTNAGATLGRVLFHDPLLSANGTVSCATCHDQKRAFAERRRTSRGVGGKRGRRNALSLVNLRYHPTNRFFWDERVSSLEEQVLEPIQDPVEMAMSLGKLPARVALRAEYAQLFEAAFGTPEVTTPRIAKALAQFVRSLTSYRSKYDVGLARVTDVQQPFPNFTALENEGKALFFGGRGGGRCASCHVADAGRGAGGRGPRAIAGRLGGETGTGNRPVLFTARRPSNNGLDRKAAVRDRGVAEVSGDDEDAGVFKVPSLRNVELTAPYMHDGRLKTLDAVIRHYDRKVEPHPNLDRRLRGRRGGATPRRLNLSSRDRRALVAFLKTLTDRAFLHDPRFANPFR